MKDYSGQKVFMGIDVHKNTYSITAIVDQQVVKKSRIPASPQQLVEYCVKHFHGAQIRSAYEAGFCGFTLHRFLEKNKIGNIVVHPASIEIASRERVKTDRRDSQKIAIQLAAGRLRSVYIPDMKREDFRLVTRLRETLAREKSRKGNQIKSFLYQLGKMPLGKIPCMSAKWLNSILKEEFTQEQRFCLESLGQQWLELALKIADIDRQLGRQAQEDGRLEEIYKSAPGVGPTIARILANELGDMSHFPNERALFSYTGLTPREYSSGEHRRLGHISQQGKPILRKMLVQAAWCAIGKDAGLKEVYERIKLKAGAKRAIIGVARRLIGRIRACINNKSLYCVEVKEGASVTTCACLITAERQSMS